MASKWDSVSEPIASHDLRMPAARSAEPPRRPCGFATV